jgi:hypothetical protein
VRVMMLVRMAVGMVMRVTMLVLRIVHRILHWLLSAGVGRALATISDQVEICTRTAD